MKRMNDFQARHHKRAQARIDQRMGGVRMDNIDAFSQENFEQFSKREIVGFSVIRQADDLNASSRQFIANGPPLLQTTDRHIETTSIDRFGQMLYHGFRPSDPQMRRYDHQIDSSLLPIRTGGVITKCE
jgi:hypothetical protein